MLEKSIIKNNINSVSDVVEHSVNVEKKHNYLNYETLCRQTAPFQTKDGYKKGRTLTLIHCFVKQDSIVWQQSLIARDQNNKPSFHLGVKYILKLKNTKWNLYRVRSNKIRISPIDEFNLFFKQKVKGKDKLSTSQISKKTKIKLMRILRTFCKRHQISLKYKSKDPLILIQELCYPYSTLYSATVRLYNSKYFKHDTCKYVLGTNGSKSRKWLIDLIKKNKFQNFGLMRQFRIRFGLEQTINFFDRQYKGVNQTNMICDHPFISEQDVRKYFSKLSDKLIKSIDIFNLYNLVDLFRMMENTDLIINDHSTIQDLHDDLTLQIRKISLLTQHKDLHTALPLPDKITEIEQKWTHPYKIVAPKTINDLITWSAVMHNCVSSYIDRVKQQDYIIFGIYDGDKLKYNLGCYINVVKSNNSQLITFDQLSGKHNSYITEPDKSSLLEVIKKVGISVH